ncbi:sensor histidine kinase [Pedococcus bigeumensis]|uniref:histidine kinase n=1 Tax=Pedococcus bigeumensis TaxID=433644 RepID=A0A502CVW7_9MICO|nr:sensor histidine kinase [Pedococcus bigeumensis]TPG16812.1 sensor histidine kinase [Pedococcus bigeumensis]
MRRALVVDAGLAVAVAAVGAAEVLFPFSSRQGTGSLAMTAAQAVAAGLVLGVRRVRPIAPPVALLVLLPLCMAVGPLYLLFYGQFLPLLLAAYSVARHGKGRTPYVGLAALAVLLVLGELAMPLLRAPGERVFHWAVLALAWAAGWALARYERRTSAATRRAIDAEVAAATSALAAVAAERARIAGELHDIVAHAVSVMVVQAGAAEQAVTDDPAFTQQALASIRSTGATALAEMRRVVEVLRDTQGDRLALAPQPGMAAIGELVEAARSGGLEATLTISGDQRELSPGLELSAYRIVQEALTNVRRHAQATAVSVALNVDDSAVRILVQDNGTGARNPVGGHGLVGMRERAALYGGSVTTEDGSEGGFAVRAVLPSGAR